MSNPEKELEAHLFWVPWDEWFQWDTQHKRQAVWDLGQRAQCMLFGWVK